MANEIGVYIDRVAINDIDHDIHDSRIAGIDSTPTSSSENVVTSGGVYSALAGKANTSDIPDAVTANPTVPSGTTPTSLTGLKIGDGYYNVDGGGGTNNAVQYVAQTLTSEQQAQARTNIGAGTYSKPSGGIPAGDLAAGVIPTVPTISTDIASDATSDTKTASPKAVKTFVDSICGNIETLLAAI